MATSLTLGITLLYFLNISAKMTHGVRSRYARFHVNIFNWVTNNTRKMEGAEADHKRSLVNIYKLPPSPQGCECITLKKKCRTDTRESGRRESGVGPSGIGSRKSGVGSRESGSRAFENRGVRTSRVGSGVGPSRVGPGRVGSRWDTAGGMRRSGRVGAGCGRRH